MCKILSLESKYSVKKNNEKQTDHGKNKDDKGICHKMLSTTHQYRIESFKANIPVTGREPGEPLYITGASTSTQPRKSLLVLYKALCALTKYPNSLTPDYFST